MPAMGLRIADIDIGSRVLVAPMSGVSDLPFRRAAAKAGARYVVTEMVAADALANKRPDVVRRAAHSADLSLSVVQLVGREARWIAIGAHIAEDQGADIIDLNMGCPSREVTGVLCGSALMRNLDHAERLIEAAVSATSRPVTLKMRLGWDDSSRNAPELAERAERCGIKAITVHARTRNQFYKGACDWRAVADVKSATRVPVIVNGDVVDAESAREAMQQSGADAVMIGRGSCGRPWIAQSVDAALVSGGDAPEPDLLERLQIVLDHFRDTLLFYGDALGVRIFRKHLAWYIEQAPWHAGADGRRAEKSRLCQITVPAELETALKAMWAA
jgi:nifR3 family TIM-barrel protein